MTPEFVTDSAGMRFPTIMLEDRQGFVRSLRPNRRVVRFELDIFGHPLRIGISFADRPAKLAELVPMARQITDLISRLITNKLNSSGRKIACQKGCAACCYYLSAVSTAEAFCISNAIFALPSQERRMLIRACCTAGRSTIASVASNRIAAQDMSQADTLQNLSDWYSSLHLRCPFLVNDCCQIYDDRPLACREYLILEGSGACGGDCTDRDRRVDIPVSIAQILAETCCKLQGRDDTVVLPLAIAYAYDNPDDARRTYPAETLVRTFVETLCDNICQNISNIEMVAFPL
ncbi:MAG: YkgJ family cysteine cluster protein [Planctomycetes bacterium]|nr:YkgJ family cysteine cluster protein [Planctomycetota bacterium]